MVRPRKISLAESGGSSRFFNNRVVSDFEPYFLAPHPFLASHSKKVKLFLARSGRLFYVLVFMEAY